MKKIPVGLAAVLVFILIISCFNSPVAQAEAVVQDMSMTPDEFRDRFNSKSKEIGADIQIGNLTKSDVGETSIYQYELVPGVGMILHSVNKTGNLCRVSLTHTPVKASGYNMKSINTYAVGTIALMIFAASPNIDNDQINKVLEGLGLTLDGTDFPNHSSDIQIGDTRYGIKSTADGTTFYIERLQPPVPKSDTSKPIIPNGIISNPKAILVGLLFFVICIPLLAFALKHKFSLRTNTAVILSSGLIVVILASTAMLTIHTSKDSSPTKSIETKHGYDMKEGVIEKNSIIAVDNDAFMELSYMISQNNVPGIMRLEGEGKVFKLHSPAKCSYSDAIMYDGVVIVVIEDGEYALKSGLTWKTFVH